MPTIRHTFSLRYNYRYPDDWGPNSIGLIARSLADIDEICTMAGIDNNEYRQIDVDLREDDPRLAKLYDAIHAKYELKPSHWHVIPVSERHRYFGVDKKVTWTDNEIDACELMQLQSWTSIGDQENGTEGQWEREEYVVRLDKKQNSKSQLGLLIPFHGLAVAEPLRSELLTANLAGLHLPPVVFVGRGPVKKPLWALQSKVIMPDTLNMLQNEQGLPVAPNTEWGCFYDDGGRIPQTLRYKRAEVAALGSFDIAMTSARIANDRKAACRWCIVSQKFRAELKRQKVPSLSYVPVVLE